MGWGSATHLFDAAVDVAVEFAAKHYDATGAEYTDPEIVREIVEAMYTQVDWEDWDTQEESKYFNHLVHVMYNLGEIDNEDYIDYLGGESD